MTIVVGANEPNPTHHVKLSRGSDEIGIILCDNSGWVDPTALSRSPYPTTALKMYQGDQKHADSEPPFKPIVQEDWSGGRGQRNFADDERRYNDGYRVDVLQPGQIILGPREHFAYGQRDLDQTDRDELYFKDLYDASRYRSSIFTSSGAYDATKIEVWARKVGTPGTLTVALYSNNVTGNVPLALLRSDTVAASEAPDKLSKLFSCPFTAYTLTASTKYHVVVYGAATDDATDHWEVGCHFSAGFYCNDGSTWGIDFYSPFFRVTDANTPQISQLFEYKRQLYFVARYDDDSNSKLYREGDRGVADSNVGYASYIMDATKSAIWVADEWIGAIALIIRGPGSEEAQPWRQIIGNTTTALEVSPDWNITHTTDTEYVIIGSNKFSLVLNLGGSVTDIAVTDEYIYFARGDSDPMLCYREYNNNGVFTMWDNEEIVKAHLLQATYHPTYGMVLWGSRNTHKLHGVSIWKGVVPKKPYYLYKDIGELAPTNIPWSSRNIASVAQEIAEGMTYILVDAAFGIGVVSVLNLDEPISILSGTHIICNMKSTAAVDATDLKFVYCDQENLGVFANPIELKTYDLSTWADLPKARDGDDDTEEDVTLDTSTYLYVCSTVRYNKVAFDLGTTVNLVAGTMAGAYYNGYAWVALTILSDTTISGGCTLGQDGTINFTIPDDWELYTADDDTGYWIRLAPSATPTPSIDIKNVYVVYDNDIEINTGVIPQNQWTLVDLAIWPTETSIQNEKEIRSIGFKLSTDLGAQGIYIKDVRIVSQQLDYIKLPAEARINGIEAYAGGQTEQRENPWVLTENNLYEIQQQNNDTVVPLALGEFAELRSEVNGKAHCVNGYYLWFNLGRKIEKYYNNQMDDVGPDLDLGLPSDRQGDVAQLISYPGRVLEVIDGGNDNYSSVVVHNAGGWHEYYRAPRSGYRIRSAHIQKIPGKVDRLWVDHGDGDLAWLPISINNPESESDYVYTHDAALITSRYSAGLQDILKYWHSIKTNSENLDANNIVAIDYRLAGETDWTEITDDFDISPYQEIDIANTYDVVSRWLDLRIRLHGLGGSSSPKVMATVVEALLRNEIKYMYTITFRLADKDVDLLGDPDPLPNHKDKLDQLDSWVNSSTPILLNSTSSQEDGLYVFPEPVPVKRLGTVTEPYTKRELHICQMTLIAI